MKTKLMELVAAIRTIEDFVQGGNADHCNIKDNIEALFRKTPDGNLTDKPKKGNGGNNGTDIYWYGFVRPFGGA